MSNILNRIDSYLEEKGISHRSFSLSIGRSAAYFSNSIKKEASPSGDLLATIVDVYPDLNLRWVLLGKGNMINSIDLAEEPSIDYEKSGLIDELIDKKISIKLEKFSEVIKEIIAGQINEEIQRTQEEINQRKIKKT